VNPASDLHPIEVDARGLRCPLPVIRLAAAALDAPVDSRITVLASDPAARHDIPAWCRMRGHELCEITDSTEVDDSSTADVTADSSTEDVTAARPAHPAYLRFVVRVRPQPPKAAGTGSGSERSNRAM
jgi:tRNA 2-thiouridine synthesizing protein A